MRVPFFYKELIAALEKYFADNKLRKEGNYIMHCKIATLL